jgi:hypothetical protein
MTDWEGSSQSYLGLKNVYSKIPDGKGVNYAANIISENMLSMCDQYLLLNHTVDQKKGGNAVPKEDAFLWIPRDGNFCVEWKDGTTSWIPCHH